MSLVSDGLAHPVEGSVDPDVHEGEFCGVGTALRGTIALAAMPVLRDQEGSRVATVRSDDLRTAAEERYRNASRELRRHPEAHAAFHWEGEAASRNRDRVDTTGALRGWLRVAGRRLVDRWGIAAEIPETAGGDLTQNAEHGGCWAACDCAFWAWRESVRMAEVIRFTTATMPTAPRYDIVPCLRSFEPNLEVYRRLSMPVLRPRPRHVFLAGRVRNLRLRCFTAVGLRRNYFWHRTSRLAGYFLGKDEPLAEIAAELYAADALREARAARPSQPPATQGETETEDEELGPDREQIRRAAQEQYAILQQTQPRWQSPGSAVPRGC